MVKAHGKKEKAPNIVPHVSPVMEMGFPPKKSMIPRSRNPMLYGVRNERYITKKIVRDLRNNSPRGKSKDRLLREVEKKKMEKEKEAVVGLCGCRM